MKKKKEPKQDLFHKGVDARKYKHSVCDNPHMTLRPDCCKCYGHDCTSPVANRETATGECKCHCHHTHRIMKQFKNNCHVKDCQHCSPKKEEKGFESVEEKWKSCCPEQKVTICCENCGSKSNAELYKKEIFSSQQFLFVGRIKSMKKETIYGLQEVKHINCTCSLCNDVARHNTLLDDVLKELEKGD